MPYTVEWYIPDRVIMFTFTGELTIEELMAANEKNIELLNTSSGHEIHVIANLQNADKIPLTVSRIPRITTAIRHDNLGWYIFITSNRLFEFLGNVISQMFRHTHMKGVASFEEAVAILQKQDPDIDWSQAESHT